MEVVAPGEKKYPIYYHNWSNISTIYTYIYIYTYI